MMTNKIEIQLERLSRNYNACTNKYDPVSLLELAHSVRFWTRQSDEFINEKSFVDKKIFSTSSLNRKSSKIFSNSKYIIFDFNKHGVTTYAATDSPQNISFMSGPHEPDTKFSTGCKVVKNSDFSITIFNFYYIEKALQEDDMSYLGSKKTSLFDTKKLNYSQWLNSSLLRIGFMITSGAIENRSLNRDYFVGLVANADGASHYSKGLSKKEIEEIELLEWLKKFKCGGIPLPYFLLMKIAKDIIDNAPTLFHK